MTRRRPNGKDVRREQREHGRVNREITADYLVVGAGASGMAFADSLIDHADVRVAMVDLRHGPGGHWLDAYPFARLHFSSSLYGVASTLLGEGRLQASGPERGMHERATAPEICAYYVRALERMVETGKLDFYPNCAYVGDRRFVSRLSGQEYSVPPTCRLVDATQYSPDIPARTPPPFDVGEGTRVIPVNDLVNIVTAPSQFVIVGAGKTATDACVWLLQNGVDPASICWVRSREPWMMNRAVFQPDPVAILDMAADTMVAAEAAGSVDEVFVGLEDAGAVLRIDQTVVPTMAKTPTIAQWEIDLLRSIENVVRLGHIREITPGRIVLARGEAKVAPDATIVHCAASGIKYPQLVPIWNRESITLRSVRAALPCFSCALIGYVEATRDDDTEKNRVCLPSPLPDTPASWIRMQVVSNRAARAFTAEPDIRAWADATPLNLSRVTPERADDPLVQAARDRYRAHVRSGMAKLEAFVGAS